MTESDATPTVSIPNAWPAWSAVYPNHPRGSEYFFQPDWESPVQFLVGRNGSGKSRTGKALVECIRNAGGRAIYLSADRLTGIMSFSNTGYGFVLSEYQGAGLDAQAQQYAKQHATQQGTANDALHVLREHPEVFLKLAALLRRAFGRRLRMVEKSGFLDPVIEYEGNAYSLLRDEGHGLRELVLLLTAVYRPDWDLLVVDEPELHLHPSLTRLWLQELQYECKTSGRRSFVITHEPRLLTPKSHEDLKCIWITQPQQQPKRLGWDTPPSRHAEVASSLKENPQIVGDMVFSPRPVLVEGPGDVAALNEVIHRTVSREEVAQTDFVPCGGKSKINLWFQMAQDVDLDVRVIADLDALFDSALQRALDKNPAVQAAYTSELHLPTPSTSQAIQPINQELQRKGETYANQTERSIAIADLSIGTAGASRRDAILEIWRKAGVWLHPQGRIEEALGMSGHAESIEHLRSVAESSGGLNRAAEWAAYKNDSSIHLLALLSLEVERIATAILSELRYSPELRFDAPVGQSALYDALLVDVECVATGRHRITVKTPQEFAGYWLEVDRQSPPATWELREPGTE